MKTFYFSRFLTLAAAFAFASGSLQAQEKANPYDQLSATLTPIAQIFSPEGKHRALRATLVLEQMTGLPTEQTGGRVEVVLEPPGRALLRGSFGSVASGREAEVVRLGQSLWISPAGLVDLFPVEAGKPSKKKKKKKEEGLEPLVLPFPPQQLALLPVLFSVRDAGRDSEGLRVLEAKLMPELAQAIARRHPDARAGDWVGRLTLRDGVLARLELARPDWSITVRVEQLELSGKLPDAVWRPTGDSPAKLEGAEARRWLNAIGRVLNQQADRLRGQ